jgi:diguanylate cyclase (GGDEF)-like protein/PAS domain S-box-containing protein
VSDSTINENAGALLASILESADDAIVSLDTTGHVISWNTGAERLFGYSAVEILGSTYRDILSGEPLKDFTLMFERGMAGESVGRHETTRPRRDGSMMDVELSLAPIFASNGSVVGETAIVHEISERKRRDREMAATVDLLLRAQSVGHIGGWTAGLAPDAPLTCTSETFRIFGTPERTDLTTADFYERVHPADLESVREAIYAATTDQGHYELEHRIVRPDGTERWVFEAADVLSDQNGIPVEMIGVVQDITERRQAEERIQSDELRLRLLAENAKDLIFYYRISPDRAFEFVSPSSVAITGYTPTELYQSSELIDQLFDSTTQLIVYERLASNNTDQAVEGEVTRKDGSKLWVSQQLNPVYDSSGNLIAVEGITRDISDRKDTETREAYAALHDPLTGLANQLLLVNRIEHGLSRADRVNSFLAVLYVDLDHFNLINEDRSHEEGDAVLKAVARRLLELAGVADTVARFSGDRFVVLCEDLVSANDLVKFAERTLDSFRSPFEIEGENVFVKASIGVATAKLDGAEQSADGLLRDANLAMYRAKAQGRNRYEMFDTALRVDAQRRSAAEAGLRRAIERDEFALDFQPVWSITQDRFIGSEALLRWHDPDKGIVAPSEFISVAEDCGLIVPIGRWVLEQACTALTQWSRMGPRLAACTVSVNVSPVQLQSRSFAGELEQLISSTRVDPTLLCLEITESVLMEEDETFSTTLHRLRDLGVQFSIDDFGTGYSSLAYLRRFPVDEVKIDQSFITGLGRDPFAGALVKAVIMIGDALNLRIVAEGVENIVQLTAFRELGGRHAQGYLLARPCDLESCSAIMDDGDFRP